MYFNCEICGKESYIRPSHFKRRKHHYCSKECAAIGQQGENNPFYKSGKYSANIKKKCVVCGKMFFKKGDSVTCSKECFAKLNSIKVSRPVIKICPECEKEFVTIPYYKDKLTFCSMECKNNYHSKIMSLDGNPRWIGGCSDKYDFKFTTELKEQVRNRDNNCCRLCGLTNEENIEFYKGSLPIHHIDYNKQNSSINNLITLCNSCHAKTNANRKQWREKLQKLNQLEN